MFSIYDTLFVTEIHMFLEYSYFTGHPFFATFLLDFRSFICWKRWRIQNLAVGLGFEVTAVQILRIILIVSGVVLITSVSFIVQYTLAYIITIIPTGNVRIPSLRLPAVLAELEVLDGGLSSQWTQKISKDVSLDTG